MRHINGPNLCPRLMLLSVLQCFVLSVLCSYHFEELQPFILLRTFTSLHHTVFKYRMILLHSVLSDALCCSLIHKRLCIYIQQPFFESIQTLSVDLRTYACNACKRCMGSVFQQAESVVGAQRPLQRLGLPNVRAPQVSVFPQSENEVDARHLPFSITHA